MVRDEAPKLLAQWSPHNQDPSNPWMTSPCRALLEGVIEMVGGRTATVLEFGMGGSTLHFAKLVKQYFAIESNPNFFHDVTHSTRFDQNTKVCLREQYEYTMPSDVSTIANHRLFSIMNSTMAAKPRSHTSRLRGFESYILQASRFGVSKFDFILIDGMARAAAAFFVLDLIDHTARVAIHDFWTDTLSNWQMCHLLHYYRIDAHVNQQMPYVSGGSVVILQKRRMAGERNSKSKFGDIVDDALHNFTSC